ncbi:hypothetical protein [Nesterenkonia alkaliphila]|uniref:Cadherin domain-containing protein n=1 Tax=Nesterenkonia alkaliphila TaxID=1463631 RepID=A0A7K1UKR5_9MICC|nr:hypothetical protein [Nesterenkonia alkaliphila]MVT26591.1 hypothetical protein [Nesterenkonia alkaliphila]GFZ92057.1 hypothetical protein GCM10011359_21660 [Nesterenkonia alkaliphila]
MKLRRSAQVLLTAAVSAAMLLTATAPVQADEDITGEPYALTPVPEAVSIETAYHRLPTVDSAAGHGTRLGEDTPAVSIPGLPEGHDAALIRLTGFDAAEHTTVSAADAPALSVAAGASASTTVLVPLVEGAVELSSDAGIDVRIELLASFAGDDAAPGATIALPEPVTRAQTAQGLGGDSLSAEGTEIGVTGQGGVPSTGVRAVWLTATVRTDSAGELSIGSQQVSLPEGTTTLTTVVPVQAGSVPFAFTGGEADLQVDVRGWSPEAPQNAEAANVRGSYVPQPVGAPQDLTISDQSPAEVPPASYADAESVVVLVSAQPGGQPTFLGDDLDAELRGSGIYVDPVVGASAQLAVLDAEQAALISRRGDAQAAVLPLGSFLAAEGAASAEVPELTITSHSDGGTVELGEDAVTVLEGTVDSSWAAQAVLISVNGEQVGTAELDYSGDTVTWRFTTGAPATASYAITVEAVDRSGAAGSQTLTLELVIPGQDEVLIHPDTVIQDEQAVVHELTDDYVVLAGAPEAEPGDILVSGSVAGAEEGFLRRVIAVDETDEGWVVHTDWATLDEAILQADVESEILWTGVEGLEFEQHSEDPDAGDVEIVDDGDIFVEVVEAPEELPASSGSAEAAGASLAPFAHPGAASSLINPHSRPMPAGFSLNNRRQQCVNMNPKFAMDSDGAKFNMASAEAKFRDKRAEILGDGGITVESDITHCTTLTFGLTIELQRTFGVPTGVEVTRFDFVVSSYTMFDNTLGVNYAISDSERMRLFTMHLPPINFAIGPVPVTLTMEAGMDFTAAWSVEGLAEVNYTAARSQDVGFRYRNGRFNAVNPTPDWSFPTTVGDDFSATASITSDASVGLNVAMSTKLYGVVGPEVGLGAAIGMDGEVDFNVGEAAIESASFEIYAERTASAGVRFRVPIINRTILEVNDIIRFDRRGTLYELSYTREEGSGDQESPEAPDPDESPEPEEPDAPGFSGVIIHPGAEGGFGDTSNAKGSLHDMKMDPRNGRGYAVGITPPGVPPQEVNSRENRQELSMLSASGLPSGVRVQLPEPVLAGAWDIDPVADRMIYYVWPENNHLDEVPGEVIELRTVDGASAEFSDPISVALPECQRAFVEWLHVDPYRGHIMINGHNWQGSTEQSGEGCTWDEEAFYRGEEYSAVTWVVSKEFELLGYTEHEGYAYDLFNWVTPWEGAEWPSYNRPGGVDSGDYGRGDLTLVFDPERQQAYHLYHSWLHSEEMELRLATVSLSDGSRTSTSLHGVARVQDAELHPETGDLLVAGYAQDSYWEDRAGEGRVLEHNLWQVNPHTGQVLTEPGIKDAEPWQADESLAEEARRYTRVFSTVVFDEHGQLYGLASPSGDTWSSSPDTIWFSSTGRAEGLANVPITQVTDRIQPPRGRGAGAGGQLFAVEPGYLVHWDRIGNSHILDFVDD